MKLAAGSLPWLIASDLRIRWRSLSLARGSWMPWALYGTFIMLLHAGAGVVIWSFSHARQSMSAADVVATNAVLLVSLSFFMLMAALMAVFRLMHASRELTPLLLSPLPFARVLWAQVVGVLVASWAVSVLLVTPIANMGLVLGHPRFLLAYPVTVALAACAVAVAFALLAGIVRAFGLARARWLMPVLQAVIPLAFVFASLFGRSPAPANTPGLRGGGLVHFSGLMTLPAQALAGDWLALALWLLLGAVALLASVRLARGALLAALVASEPPGAGVAGTGAARAFHTGLFRVLLLKEWRTILREPRLATALLVQPLIVIPAFYLNLMQGRFRAAGAVAMLSFVAAQLSQFVANLMISAEEAPALLGSAPISRRRLIAYKCIAALAPILMLLLAASAWLATRDPWAGAVGLFCCLGAAFCACAIEVARPYPAPRRSFVQIANNRRRRDPLDLLSVLMMQLGWTAAAWFLAARNPWGAAIVLVLILVPFLEWWRDINRQDLLGY